MKTLKSRRNKVFQAVLLVSAMLFALSAHSQTFEQVSCQASVMRLCESNPAPSRTSFCVDSAVVSFFEISNDHQYFIRRVPGEGEYVWKIDAFSWTKEGEVGGFEARDVTDNMKYLLVLNFVRGRITMFSESYPNLALHFFGSDGWLNPFLGYLETSGSWAPYSSR